MKRIAQPVYFTFMAVLGLVLLASCSSPTATPSPIEITPTFTATTTPTPDITSTADASYQATLNFNETQNAAHIATSEAELTATSQARLPNSTPTRPLTATLTLVTPPPPETSLISQSLTSPDGQWIAEASFEFLEGDAGFRVRLVVRRIDQSVEWVPVDYTQEGLGYIYPAIRYWSPDSRHFYYFNMPTPDGCGDFYPEEDQWVGLDVTDGLLSTLPLPPGRGHTISPDGGTMIYATSIPPFELRFREIQSGIEKSLPLPPSSEPKQEVQAGGWIWSPDGSSVALSVAYGDSCGDWTKLSFSVVRVDDLTNPTLVPLVERNAKLIRLLAWETPDRILVKDWNGYSWWMDSRNGQEAPAP
ncbi:MAG TPA: hypothetical protein VLA49_19745 [Anaerolineales bacterium]|nr:hypothetical protein [Anaerolineales bacterium]